MLGTAIAMPAHAQLVLDSGDDRVQAIESGGGRYVIELPFSFIKAHDYLYFHSVYKGQHRYYRYHLRTQRQEQLPR